MELCAFVLLAVAYFFEYIFIDPVHDKVGDDQYVGIFVIVGLELAQGFGEGQTDVRTSVEGHLQEFSEFVYRISDIVKIQGFDTNREIDEVGATVFPNRHFQDGQAEYFGNLLRSSCHGFTGIDTNNKGTFFLLFHSLIDLCEFVFTLDQLTIFVAEGHELLFRKFL